MKLYFMKQKALDYMKANIGAFYEKYYREKNNLWVKDLFDYDPFEVFMEIPDFELMPLTNKKGEVDIENCKIMYSKLLKISESQASDERLWAGLCHSTFYDYVVNRWDYRNLKLKDSEKDASAILSRFFFSGGIRAGFFRNTLAKYWWVGKVSYEADKKNRFEILDNLGPEDFATKTNELFYSNTFSSNQAITRGVSKAWKQIADEGKKLTVKEYLRPALQYLNALGGGILLDSLDEKEVQELLYNYMMQLYNGEVPADIIEDEFEQDNVKADEENEEMIASETINEFREQFDEEKQRKKKGCVWIHRTFGRGVVIDVKEDTVMVQFSDGKVRPMSYKHCWGNGVVKLGD